MADETGPNPHVKAKETESVPDSKTAASDKPPVTHDLYLADGSTVESSGAVPTHIAVGDRAIPVLSAVERQEQ